MFVFLSAVAGFFGFALAGFVIGFIAGSGPVQSHALSATIVGGLLALYFSPVGLLTGLIGSLALRDKSAKKMALLLLAVFTLTAGASLAYIYFTATRKV